jgi:isoleucyl-tRNA synthetase
MGQVRELTHRIQLARKNAGFDVTDRIAVTYRADDHLGGLIAENTAEIAEEILATDLVEGATDDGEYAETIEVEGMTITVSLRRLGEDGATKEA